MCTVTYMPPTNKADFILTSNRDERTYRAAVPPKLYSKDKFTLCYPKDSKAGGSWIATNNMGRLSCLLNGGFISHDKQDFHTYSRGQILLGFVTTDVTIHYYFENRDLSQVEPFTLIALDRGNNLNPFFTEFIWDGEFKHFKNLDRETPYIWSSATLYNQENRNKREQWFSKFLKTDSGKITADTIMAFHSGRHTPDISNNLVMEREDDLKTVSITQVRSIKNKFHMRYHDLVEGLQNEVIL